MKNSITRYLVLVVCFAAMAGCKKSFGDLFVNGNSPQTATPSLLLNSIENQIYEAPYGDKERWDQYFLINYEYYGNNRYDFGSGDNYYTTLTNVKDMDQEAQDMGLPADNAYHALALFFRAYLFTKMSLEMGDIPMAEALNGTDNLKPAYDKQKDVFLASFKLLDSANSILAALAEAHDANLDGDIYFDNDLAKWQKTVNTYRIRTLIELSKKETDQDLNLKSQFSTIINNPEKYPVMESSEDNLQYVFLDPTNKYPQNPDNFGFDALRYNCSNTYVSILTQLKDPRVYAACEPAKARVKTGIQPTDFNAFLGADPGEALGDMYAKTNAGVYSLINRWRYYSTYTGEPSIQVGYPELMFNIAEGISRGWATAGPLGQAEAYYKAGIKASWALYNIPESGVYTAHFLNDGEVDNPASYNTYNITISFNNYYNQSLVKYAGDNASGLQQILEQKYLAMFRHSGLEAYYQYRRTGIPEFTAGPGTGNSGRIARRFQYFSHELSSNTENYQNALDSQFGGNDDINGVMWLLQ